MLSVVALERVDKRSLDVRGLDAINDTQVLDIKPVYSWSGPRSELRVAPWSEELGRLLRGPGHLRPDECRDLGSRRRRGGAESTDGDGGSGVRPACGRERVMAACELRRKDAVVHVTGAVRVDDAGHKAVDLDGAARG